MSTAIEAMFIHHRTCLRALKLLFLCFSCDRQCHTALQQYAYGLISTKFSRYAQCVYCGLWSSSACCFQYFSISATAWTAYAMQWCLQVGTCRRKFLLGSTSQKSILGQCYWSTAGGPALGNSNCGANQVLEDHSNTQLCKIWHGHWWKLKLFVCVDSTHHC